MVVGGRRVDSISSLRNSTDACLHPATVASSAVEAARDKIAPVSHEAAVRLYDVLADRLRWPLAEGSEPSRNTGENSGLVKKD
jgi:hypothetical protein